MFSNDYISGEELIDCIYNASFSLEEAVVAYGEVDEEELRLRRAESDQFEQDITISRYGNGRKGA